MEAGTETVPPATEAPPESLPDAPPEPEVENEVTYLFFANRSKPITVKGSYAQVVSDLENARRTNTSVQLRTPHDNRLSVSPGAVLVVRDQLG